MCIIFLHSFFFPPPFLFLAVVYLLIPFPPNSLREPKGYSVQVTVRDDPYFFSSNDQRRFQIYNGLFRASGKQSLVVFDKCHSPLLFHVFRCIHI